MAHNGKHKYPERMNVVPKEWIGKIPDSESPHRKYILKCMADERERIKRKKR